MNEQEILRELCRSNDSLSYYAYCLIKQLLEQVDEQKTIIECLVSEIKCLNEND